MTQTATKITMSSARIPSQPDAKALDLTHQDSSRADIIDIPRETPGEVLVSWNKRDMHYFDAYRIDIATGARPTMVAKNPGDVEAWCSDTHGRVRGATALLKNTNTEIRVRPDEAAPFKTIATYNYDEEAVHPRFRRGRHLSLT